MWIKADKKRGEKCELFLYFEANIISNIASSDSNKSFSIFLIAPPPLSSMWIKADKKRGEKCGNCPLWASCFNSFCPFKTSLFHNNIEPSVCSGEHQNIGRILNLLLSPYNSGNIEVQKIGWRLNS